MRACVCVRACMCACACACTCACMCMCVYIGMTQASIPSLVKKGIKGISVGVNDRSPPPNVPSLFIWQFADDNVMATWHPGTDQQGMYTVI